MSDSPAKPKASINRRILVVEHETEARELIRRSLEREGFNIEEVVDAAQAIERMRRSTPDLIVLDQLDFCRRLRSAPQTAALPILAVSTKGTVVDRVRGLETGADDYLVKPFSPLEFVARVKALLRRCERGSEPEGADFYRRGRLTIDFGAHEIFIDGQRRDLTPREFELFRFLLQHPTRACGR
jgi:two-component system alkaline phosphatase synthesis response regulator PhoP